MKKLSSIFIAIAVFCFVAFTSCQSSTTTEEPAAQEEVIDEAAAEVIEEVVDSSAVEGEMTEETEATTEEAAH